MVLVVSSRPGYIELLKRPGPHAGAFPLSGGFSTDKGS
jgi:hypothetical protein